MLNCIHSKLLTTIPLCTQQCNETLVATILFLLIPLFNDALNCKQIMNTNEVFKKILHNCKKYILHLAFSDLKIYNDLMLLHVCICKLYNKLQAQAYFIILPHRNLQFMMLFYAEIFIFYFLVFRNLLKINIMRRKQVLTIYLSSTFSNQFHYKNIEIRFKVNHKAFNV